LNDVGDCLLLDTPSLVDILEGVQFLGSLVLNNANLGTVISAIEKRERLWGTDLAEGTLAHCAVEVEVVEVDLTLEIYWFRKTASHIACDWERKRRPEVKR
jgi:hypothetical protein